jgi:hypothetical protein
MALPIYSLTKSRITVTILFCLGIIPSSLDGRAY